MPAISFLETVSTQSGTNAPASGTIVFTPTATFGGSGGGGAEEVIPKSFSVTLDATGAATVTLAVTGTTWVWRVDMVIAGTASTTQYVTVKAGDTQWVHLTRVDPTTLAPNAPVATIVDGGSASLLNKQIQPRRDTAANWLTANPILSQGEEGLETDTGLFKSGDGSTAWTSLGYANKPSQSAGAKVAAMGDSITASNDFEAGFNGQTNNLYQDSWIDYACMLSGGLLRRGPNFGIPGQTSVQMAARFVANVIPANPSTVIILCGTNDVGQSVSAGGTTPDATTITNFKASIQSMVKIARANGIRPILSTIPPNNASNRHTLINQLNLWIKLYASTSGLTILDYYGQAADPTSGNYLASWNSADGTHPGPAGYAIFGQYIANKLSPLIGVNAPFVAQDDVDPVNLLTHPLFLGGALSAQGIPPGWAIASGFPTGLTVSYVTDSAVGGNMWQVAAVASPQPYYISFTIPTSKWTVGDTIAISGILTSNGGIPPAIALANQNGVLAHLQPAQPVARGYFYMEQIVPAGSTTMLVELNTAAGTGTWSVGQLGVYNLTQLGLLSVH